ncbi:MAG: hypothetical protein Q6352_016830 [Candidatus Freyrarchaeum guaymaensis]|nr:hypothetical protein [Candidatus Sigynarchaeota archaeon]
MDDEYIVILPCDGIGKVYGTVTRKTAVFFAWQRKIIPKETNRIFGRVPLNENITVKL